MIHKSYTLLEESIGYVFNDKDLLKRALTHSSYANEQRINKLGDYERLEFLGDAVLELVSSEFFYHQFPNLPEGQLTKKRSSHVCEPALAYCARDFGLDQYIMLGKGEEMTGGRNRDSIISDASADADSEATADADASADSEADADADASADSNADADADASADSDADADSDATADSDASADADSDATSDSDATADAGHNTLTNGNNTIINVTDNSSGYIAMSLSTLIMMESLLGNQNSEQIEPLVSKFSTILNELLQEENSNRKAILDVIKSLNKEE